MNVSYDNFNLAHTVWTQYSLKPNSKHMATLSALACLAQLLTDTKPRRIIELGGGIGTISKLLMSHYYPPSLLITLEDSPICLPELQKLFANEPDQSEARWRIVTKPEGFKGKRADLLIVDAGVPDEALETIYDGTTIYLEGNRGPEREKIAGYLSYIGLTATFREEKLHIRDEPSPGKGCWIGKVCNAA